MILIANPLQIYENVRKNLEYLSTGNTYDNLQVKVYPSSFKCKLSTRLFGFLFKSV